MNDRLFSLKCWEAMPCLIPLLPASSHPFPSSYFTDSDFTLCTSLSIFLLVSPKQLICPSVLTLFHHVSSPFSHLLLINFILWLPDALPPSSFSSSSPSTRSALCPPFLSPPPFDLSFLPWLLCAELVIVHFGASVYLCACVCVCVSLSSPCVWTLCISVYLNQGLAGSRWSVGESLKLAPCDR